MSKETPQQELKNLTQQSLKNEEILKEIKGNVMHIILNRPKRSNGLTGGMYVLIGDYLYEASKNKEIKVVIIRGNGKNFCSGNDLSNFAGLTDSSIEYIQERAKFTAHHVLKYFTNAFLDCKKTIIALVQGASIGVGFTFLGLCDLVYSTENAFFQAPLVKLAQGAEMCSSYTFPQIFGRQKAFEIINLGNVYKAKEFSGIGFILQQFGTVEELYSFGNNVAEQITELDEDSLLESKRLLNQYQISTLKQVTEQEIDNLVIRWSLPDKLMPAIMKHLSNKPKL